MSRPITKERVLELLREGWELGADISHAGSWWMQRGLGRGGESYRVNANSAWSLLKNKEIVCVERKFPTARYELAKREKEA